MNGDPNVPEGRMGCMSETQTVSVTVVCKRCGSKIPETRMERHNRETCPAIWERIFCGRKPWNMC